MKPYTTILLILIALISCNKKPEGYTINGKIDGVENALIVVETRTEGLNFIDSTRVKNGEFRLVGNLEYPTYFRVTLTDNNGSRYRFGFLAENSNIALNYNINTDVLTVEGSQSNNKLDSIRIKLGDNLHDIYKAAADNKNSYEYTYLVYEKLIQDDWNKLDTIISMISPELQETQYAKLIKSEIERAKNLEIGGVAPNFTITDIKGNQVSLSDYRGKILLLDFGASWCHDCIKEQNELIKIYENKRDNNLEILNVACEKNAQSWSNWYNKYQIPYNTVSDLKGWSNHVAVLYNIRWLPTYFLIDEQGIIVNKATTLSDLNLE